MVTGIPSVCQAVGVGLRTQQREATRRALVAEARGRFAAQGYAAVGLPEIVAGAGVSKGALYHQFSSKADLFRAVLVEVQVEVADAVVASAARRRTAWTQLLAGCEAFLTASTAPDVQRIMLLDGPVVLGWAAWRELDEAHSARHLREALQALIDDKTFVEQPVEPLTRLVSGAMNEAALWLADTGAAASDRRAIVRALESLLDGLRRP